MDVRLEKLDGWPTGTAALRPYNLILLCSPMPMHILNMISKYAQEQSVPVVYIHSRGFYGSFSVQLPEEFPIVDTHPDPESIQDLRLLAPFPELQKELLRIGNIENLDDDDHGHVPWLVILLYYLEEWKISHGNKLPHTFKEKMAFRDFVRSKARTDNSEGGEENFDEAVSAVLKTVTPPAVGSGCREMFEMDFCSNLTVEIASFWITASAIKTFHKRHGVLPLPGSLPDMKARSQYYIQLQQVYKKKARDDVAEVLETVRTTEKALSRNSSPIPYEEVEAFCKNASHVKVVRGRTLVQARLFAPSNSPAQKEEEDLLPQAVDPGDDDDEEQDPSFASLLPIFAALLASEHSLKDGTLIRFFSENTKFFQLTPRQMNACVGLVRELSNARGGELHNISSIMGGMVAQEAIKILTRQYVPVSGTCVFDGVQGRTEILHI
jgi:NEDD8-activating enzyme E1 regulatory subunit